VDSDERIQTFPLSSHHAAADGQKIPLPIDLRHSWRYPLKIAEETEKLVLTANAN
jgi:hypothetical protein